MLNPARAQLLFLSACAAPGLPTVAAPMSVKISFNSATVTNLVLAKVGNPQREEPLTTSKEVFRVDEDDREKGKAPNLTDG